MCIILFLTSSIDIWIINTCYFFKKLTVYMYEALKKKSWVIFLIYFHDYFHQSRGVFESYGHGMSLVLCTKQNSGAGESSWPVSWQDPK